LVGDLDVDDTPRLELDDAMVELDDSVVMEVLHTTHARVASPWVRMY